MNPLMRWLTGQDKVNAWMRLLLQYGFEDESDPLYQKSSYLLQTGAHRAELVEIIRLYDYTFNKVKKTIREKLHLNILHYQLLNDRPVDSDLRLFSRKHLASLVEVYPQLNDDWKRTFYQIMNLPHMTVRLQRSIPLASPEISRKLVEYFVN